jgi:FkbM family methyltransferase
MSDMNNKFFVEIGSNYYETLLPLAKEAGWKGLLVEPVPEYFNMIERVPGVFYENSAIGLESKAVTFFYIPQNTMYAYGFGEWVRGLGSIDINHFEVKFQGLVEKIKVPMITVKELLDKYNIRQIDYLKIDAEGMDCDILSQFDISNIERIMFEWRNCPLENTNGEIQRLTDKGFVCQVDGDNIKAYKNINPDK